MNIAGCGMEWLFAPLLLFTRTDYWIFLINLFSYLLLPGLVFSVFKRLQVSPRVAWWWMWVLSAGWCFVLQAVSTLNDSLGAVYALAALGFALRARETGKFIDLGLSLLAAGLMTGIKQTNLPLLLPWLIAVWPAWRSLMRYPISSGIFVLWSLLVSVIPMAFLNWHYVGTWTGFPKVDLGQAWSWGVNQELNSPVWGIIGNVFCLSIQNLLPLFFPQSSAWNNTMQHFLTTPLGSHFTGFESFGHLGRSVSESTAGIGLGIVILTLISILGAHRFRKHEKKEKSSFAFKLLLFAPWLALLVFMAKVGTYQNARQMAPYYALLFPLILTGAGHVYLVRRRWWQWLVLAILLVTFAYMGFIRGRSVIPNAMALRLQEKYPHSKFLSVFKDYFVSRSSFERTKNFLNRESLADEKIIGYATTCGGAEPGFWIPFGHRRVERVLPQDTPSELRQKGIRYVVVEEIALQLTHQTIEQWMEQYNGQLVDQLEIMRDPGTPPGCLYLVCLRE